MEREKALIDGATACALTLDALQTGIGVEDRVRALAEVGCSGAVQTFGIRPHARNAADGCGHSYIGHNYIGHAYGCGHR